MRRSRREFILEQGYVEADPGGGFYTALMLQPRIVGVVVAAGMVLQSPRLFLALSALMWWAAFVPSRNVFDALYNYVVAYPRSRRPLDAAPPPRRFATGMAAAFLLAIGVALLAGAATTAWIIEGLLMAAVMSVVVRRFCAGSYLFSVLRDRRDRITRIGARGSGVASL